MRAELEGSFSVDRGAHPGTVGARQDDLFGADELLLDREYAVGDYVEQRMRSSKLVPAVRIRARSLGRPEGEGGE